MSKEKLWKILKYFLIFLAIGIVAFIAIFKKEELKILGIYFWLFFRPEVFMFLAFFDGQSAIAIFIQVFAFTTFTTLITWKFTDMGQKDLEKISKEDKLNFLERYYLIWGFVSGIVGGVIVGLFFGLSTGHGAGIITALVGGLICRYIKNISKRIDGFKTWLDVKQKKLLNWFLQGGCYYTIISFVPPVLPGKIGKVLIILIKILVKIINLPFLLLIRLGRYNIMIPFALPVLPGMDTACVILAKVIKLPYALALFLAINSIKIVIILLICIYAPNVFHWLFG